MAEAIPYRPSNGTEGEIFMSQWCARCVRDEGSREDSGDGCAILADTFAYRISEPEYPKEWRSDGPQGPRCTAFTDDPDAPLRFEDHPQLPFAELEIQA